jgi:hypothetical protein
MISRTLPSFALLALGVLGSPALARADEGAPLRAAAHEWFDGERRSGYLWGGAGVLSLGAAASLHRFGRGSAQERGMAYPLAAFGLLQTAIGVGALLRSNDRVDRLDAHIARSPEDARRSEIDRMRTINTAFLAIEVVEALVLVGGVTLAATHQKPEQGVTRGVGLGFALEGGLMMLLDSLAASRARTYAGKLDTLSFSGTSQQGVRYFSLRGSF